MTQSDNDYDQWAWLYNKTLGPGYQAQKMTFLEHNLLAAIAPNTRVLDLCCGTGQMIAPLLARGYEVTGLDLSHDMLRFAKSNAPGAQFVQGDAREFTFENRFSGILCTSASLNHMTGAADLAKVFASVNAALEMGGIFTFDINHPTQMEYHWRNQPAAGEIAADYAWLITPRYDAAMTRGAFKVDMYLRPDVHKTPLASRLIDRIMRNRFLWRLRLRRLANFAASHSVWDHQGTDFEVYGHDLQMVSDLLETAGFDVSLQNISGEPVIKDRDAAFFVCRKIAEPTQAKEAAE